jgi:hypothetical protein
MGLSNSKSPFYLNYYPEVPAMTLPIFVRVNLQYPVYYTPYTPYNSSLRANMQPAATQA